MRRVIPADSGVWASYLQEAHDPSMHEHQTQTTEAAQFSN